ncbi:MAG: class I SAM-dependent methyltransferase [Chloroflexota bacterium]|nr:class I SAM-dependent methyltransferase [Chloroflexota bacterium]MDQ5867816.1 class I SAM-dependent methyltransferase [Chloroflexota bacterium]
MHDVTKRFSTRVENYIRYRPHYPPEVLETLVEKCALTQASVVADVGSGTGILSEVFLRNGNLVYGIEPNQEMREAAERLLSEYPNFHSLDARAEATTLPTRSVDFVTAGQAYHWFDREGARAEFARILRPGGWVALVWNLRQTGTTPFLRDYEALLNTYGTDYTEVHFRGDDSEDSLHDFYGGDGPQVATFSNSQHFDFDGLKGRLLSSSYAPEPGHPNHEPMLNQLRAIFDKHQADGKVAFLYNTRLYYGRLG